MTIKLNHTIVHSDDKRAAAKFFTELFGLPAAKTFGPFLDVEVGNEVTLAFMDAGRLGSADAALCVSRERNRVRYDFRPHRGAQGSTTGPIQGKRQKGEVNRHYGGRGVYFCDPSGHLLEIITRPYGDQLPGE
jgi:catechol 2,3-dioxygenase-like lactoylglutathione lyase family enzyme